MLAFFFKEFSGAQIPEGPLQIPQNASSQTNKVLKMLNGWANKTLDTPVAKTHYTCQLLPINLFRISFE